MTATRPPIPVARPWLDERDAEAARRAILSGWVTQGPETAAFEHEFAAAVGAAHACAVSSCTAALHLALVALGVGPGEEVVTVSHSFVATANAVRYCGATPVFVDVTLDTFNIDPELVREAITSRTRALLVVHQLGMPCDLSRLVRIANERALPLVEDAACAIGSEVRWDGEWERVGRPRGAIACFSFHPRKLLSTGDGGMVTTNDAAIDAKLRRLRQHGMSVSDVARHAAREVVFEEYVELGFNYRMTDIQAAIGRCQLARLPDIIARRRALASRYDRLLAAIPGVVCPAEPEWARSNWQSYAVRLDGGVDQRAVMVQMLADGISTRRGVMNAHEESAYPSRTWRTTSAGLGRSEQLRRSVLILPLYYQMSDADQERVVDALERAVGVVSERA